MGSAESGGGRELELDVTKIAHGGIAVARHEGRVVFVADAIPGERVLARVTAESRSFWRAVATRVLEPSPHRVPHIWREAGIDRDPEDRAGGAEFGHIALAHQRTLKAEVLREALARFARIDTEVEVTALPGEPDGTGWRTRLQLHVSDDGAVGPYAARSHRVIPVVSLPLAAPELAALAPARAEPPANQTAARLLLVAPSADAPRIVGTGGDGQRRIIHERVGEREFQLDEDGFWQVHRAAAAALTTAVQEAVDPALLDSEAENLDLYGGVGLLAAAVADGFDPRIRITTVESDPAATAHAARNLADLAAQAATGRVERWLRGIDALPGATVVLDPPRAGAGAEVLGRLAALGPAQIVYVACDPVALARDAGTLAGLGYVLTRLRAYDLFPHTHHLEAVASFQRA